MYPLRVLFVNMSFNLDSPLRNCHPHHLELTSTAMSKPSTSASKPPANDEIDRLLKQEATAVSRDVEVCNGSGHGYPENGVIDGFLR